MSNSDTETETESETDEVKDRNHAAAGDPIDMDEWIAESSRQKCIPPVTWEDANGMHPLNVLRVLGTADKKMTGYRFLSYMLTLFFMCKCLGTNPETLLSKEYHFGTGGRSILGSIIDQAQLRNVVKFQTLTLMRKFSHLKNVRANNPKVPVKDLILNIDKYLGNINPQPVVPNNDGHAAERSRSGRGGKGSKKTTRTGGGSASGHKRKLDLNAPARRNPVIPSSIPRYTATVEERELYNLQSQMSRYDPDDLYVMVERQRTIRDLCDKLNQILRNKLTTSDNYRAGGIFKVRAMKQFGWTCNTRGLNSFNQPHGFIRHMGAHQFDYHKMPEWKQRVYDLAVELFTIIDRHYQGDRQFVVTISVMCPGSEVDRHRDMRDIGPQMLLSLGDFIGGMVRCFDEGNGQYVDVSTRYNPTICDGRLDHVVHPVTEGIRIGVYVYRMNDNSQLAPHRVHCIVSNDPRRMPVVQQEDRMLPQSDENCAVSHDVSACLDGESADDAAEGVDESNEGPGTAVDPRLSYPPGKARFGIRAGDIIPPRSEALRHARNLDGANIRRLKIVSSKLNTRDRWRTVEAVARCWMAGRADQEQGLDLIGNSLIFGKAILRSLHDARRAVFPRQQDRPTIKALVEFGKRISNGNIRNLVARLPEFTRAVACTLSAHAYSNPDKDAIYRLQSMDVAEFIETFRDYRSAKEWNVTRKSKDTFLDCYQESFLQQVGSPKYGYEELDSRLEKWCQRLSVGMSILDYDKSITKRSANTHPHLVSGKLMRIHFVVVFAELGIIRKDDDLRTWLPGQFTKKAGSVNLCQTFLGIKGGKKIRRYLIDAAKRNGVEAYNYENVMCKLWVAFFKVLLK